MDKIKTNFSVVGYETPAFGFTAIIDNNGEPMPASSLRPYIRQPLKSKAQYNSEQTKLVLTLAIDGTAIRLEVDLDEVPAGMNNRLMELAEGGVATTTVKSVTSTLLGLQVE